VFSYISAVIFLFVMTELIRVSAGHI